MGRDDTVFTGVRSARPPSSFTCQKGHGTLQAAIEPPGHACAFPTRFVGSGLFDDRHVVEELGEVVFLLLDKAHGQRLEYSGDGERNNDAGPGGIRPLSFV